MAQAYLRLKTGRPDDAVTNELEGNQEIFAACCDDIMESPTTFEMICGIASQQACQNDSHSIVMNQYENAEQKKEHYKNNVIRNADKLTRNAASLWMMWSGNSEQMVGAENEPTNDKSFVLSAYYLQQEKCAIGKKGNGVPFQANIFTDVPTDVIKQGINGLGNKVLPA